MLKQRNDLIPDLLDTIKDYSFDNILVNINDSRNSILSSKTRKEKMKNSNILANEISCLFAITEDYDELKESARFLDIQNKIHDTEDQINNSRRKYNNLVLDYKSKLHMFPSKIVASIFNLKEEEYFDEEVFEILEI